MNRRGRVFARDPFRWTRSLDPRPLFGTQHAYVPMRMRSLLIPVCTVCGNVQPADHREQTICRGPHRLRRMEQSL
jgi:hypothetical protein